MISLAHIINPVVTDRHSDLTIAQPVTFATMKTACEFSREYIEVRLYATQYSAEERVTLPPDFIRAPDLTRSITDLKTFKEKRKLPLIKDILDTLYETDSADFLIYTNVDIALQPYFYQAVAAIIAKGYDAFIINRRTIPGGYKIVDEIPMMYAEPGEKHPGWDCFIFHRALYHRFELGTACIGSGWIGRVLITNMSCFASKFGIFEDLHLTFHIGNEKSWQVSQYDDYLEHNKNECRKILEEFDRKYGPFDRHNFPGRFFSRL